jgi:hypothetical protein
MKRKPRRVNVVRYKLPDGLELTQSIEDGLTASARQLHGLAAVEADAARRAELLTKAGLYELAAREFASRRAVDEHTQPRRRAGGVTTAKDRAKVRGDDETKLFAEAAKIWKVSPRMPTLRVAGKLAERADIKYRSVDDIRQRIAHLRPQQK